MGTLVLKLPDELIEKLRRRAREEGFTLLADYIKSVLYREVGMEYAPRRDELIESVRRMMEGEVPPRLKERIESLVLSTLESKAKDAVGHEPVDVDKLVVRVERRIMDVINPFTSKVDELARRVSELQERLEALESTLEQASRRPQQVLEEKGKPVRKSAAERLREQGVVFESELGWLRDADAFFEKLRREGALIIKFDDERVALDKEFWNRFVRKLSGLATSNEDELRRFLRRQEYKLFRRLKEHGYIYYDSTEGRWNFAKSVGPSA